MRQTVVWLALALLFAIGVTLSFTADSFGPTATAETTGPATLVETPQPAVAETTRPVVIETPRPVVAADAKPAEPEVPVAMLDDAPPRSSIRSDALARWYAEPSASPPTRGRAAVLWAPRPMISARMGARVSFVSSPAHASSHKASDTSAWRVKRQRF